MNIITTKCINGTLKVGDLVISTPTDEYSCLIGTVKEINLRGTPRQIEETGNDSDDVHVNFLVHDYSEKRVVEIEGAFSSIYGTEKSFDDCALDNVIMRPDNLIRITGIDKGTLYLLLQSAYNAAHYCYGVLSKQLTRMCSCKGQHCCKKSD